MGASRWVHLDVTKILKETDQALLVQIEDGEQVWLPKSQLSDPDDYAEGDEDVTVSITEWLAKQKGLET